MHAYSPTRSIGAGEGSRAPLLLGYTCAPIDGEITLEEEREETVVILVQRYIQVKIKS
jgi:hypothetical protein